MANLRHPVDVSIEDLAFLRLDIERDFMDDDGTICATERGILIDFEAAVQRMSRARTLERATELAMKQGGVVTRYTRERFEEAGLHIEPIDANGPEAA